MENPFGFFKRNASAAATDVDAAMSDVGPDELQIVERKNYWKMNRGVITISESGTVAPAPAHLTSGE